MLVVGWKNIRTLPPQTKNAIAMMKKLTFFLVAALLLLLGACSNDVLDLGTDTTTNNANAPRGFVSMDQAKARLANIVNQLNSQTSDASQRFPAVTLSRLTGVALGADMKPLTRTDDQTQAGCYLLRMDNDMFAIMSATTSRPELLAIGNGYPNFEDSTALVPNPYYWDPKVTVGDTASVDPNRCDTMFEEPLYVDYRVVQRDLVPVKWGNKVPFNDKLRLVKSKWTGDSVHAAVGCVGVAVGQLMTAKKLRGANYRGYYYDWDMLSGYRDAYDFMDDPDAREEVSSLFRDIVNEENIAPCDTCWGGDVTWASPYRVTRTLENFNFKTPGRGFWPYDFDIVASEVEAGYPVLFFALETETQGHLWVAHGILEATVTMGVFQFNKNGVEAPNLVLTYTYPVWYFQMNWGWDGKADGFYMVKYDSRLDNKKGADLPEDSVDTGGGYNIYRPNTLQMDFGFRYRYNNQAEIK